MKNKQFYPKVSGTVYSLIIVIFLTIWLVSMYCVTAVKAEREAMEYLEENRNRASKIADMSFEYWLERDDITENYAYNKLWEAVSTTGVFSSGTPIIGGHSGFFELGHADMTYTSNVVFDSDGNLIVSSAEDFFYFEYLTEKQWNNNEERSDICTRAVFDRSFLTEHGIYMVEHKDIRSTARALRLIGSFDGNEFIPVRIDCIPDKQFHEALEKEGSSSYTVSAIANKYGGWVTIYQNQNAVPPYSELTTIYSDWFDACCPLKSPSFKYNGSEYTGLDELVAEVGPGLVSRNKNLSLYQGTNLIIISADYCETVDGETYFDSYYSDAITYEEGIEHEMHFYIVSAVLCSPWKTAIAELVKVYCWSFVISAALIILLCNILKKHLIAPVERISSALCEDLPLLENENYKWREVRALYDGYTKTADICRLRINEITRLNTALDYAKTAEINRRQMTSNIAHELKTPIAVIHSYAEGLKEQIAEEKRDKYLDVILSEAQRMDCMVLEMLDLSRLEAGKVKLSVDTFSLISITKSIVNKLSMAAETKNLCISCNFPDECTITADEARISQVIENFVTNAIKYTPPHGNITVNISARKNATTFSIENDSSPLSSEALSKVWDTFYRTDEARSGNGTGLGLAISKNIIELHGGKCYVENTKSGVKFSFILK